MAGDKDHRTDPLAETIASSLDERSSLDDDSTPSQDLGSMAWLLKKVAAAPGGELGSGGPLAKGQIVAGKYRVERAIGEGGMGIVYRARDLKLDRDAAIKVGSQVSPTTLVRVEREAQALARLSHPNVVVVYEVGEVDGRVFVAMEFVPGGTARAWAAATPRTAREIVALYCAAGDGLAAAHAAGIVHRDFKPDNVLVGDDGRPRVADFGLARGAPRDGATTITPDDATIADADASPIDVTRAGQIVGTPAYMPPEQLAGKPVDARADQFAFCAAVWESLHGERPFPGTTPIAVREAIESSEPRTTAGPGARRIPRHVDVALRRGLRADPAERWPAMQPLLAELRRDPSRRRRHLALAGGIAVALAVAAIVPLALRGSRPAPCADDAAALATTWSAGRADAIGRTFAGASAATTWAAIRPRLDGYARDWRAGRHAACTATRVDGSQSEAVLDHRMICLDGARAQLDAVLARLATGRRDVIAGAPQALDLLPDLGACADVANLAGQAPLPADPAARAAIARAQAAVAKARADELYEDVRDPIALGDQLVADVTAAGWPPLIASATRIRAGLLLDADRVDDGHAALQQAASLALGAGDEREAAMAFTDLAWDLAAERHSKDAASWLDLARAIWKRHGEEPSLGVHVLGTEAQVDILLGRLDDVLAVTRRQAELSREAFGDDRYELAASHDNLAVAYVVNGRFDDALREIQLALPIAEAAFGKDSPMVGRYLCDRGEVEGRLGKLAPALADLQRGVDLLESWYGETVRVGEQYDRLAVVEMMRGDETGARAAFDRELTIFHAREPDSRRLPDIEVNVGIMLAQFGHCDDALPYGERGLVAHKTILGADNPLISNDYIMLGFCKRALGKLADAEAAEREAARVIEARFGTSDPQAINPRIELSYTLVREHKAAEAAALLAPMVALAEASKDTPPPVAAEAHQAYADALWQSGGDRARARAAATTAHDAYTALGAGFEAQAADSAKWLAAHR